jgi:hypothetical protein
MRNIHPADELAMIRADLRRLKEREAFLRKGFLEMRHDTRGVDAVATVKVLKTRRFCRDRLPSHVLENADYWETQIVRQVEVDEAAKVSGRIPAFIVDDGEFDVIERF